MESTMYLNSLYELSEIIKNLSDKIKAKIPADVIDYIENNKSQNYVWNYEPNIPLNEQNMLPETEELLTAIYRDYICSDEEKEVINNILIDNENYLKEYSQTVNENVHSSEPVKAELECTDSVVQNIKIVDDEDDKVNLNSPVVVEKQNFFLRTINKIKSFLKK